MEYTIPRCKSDDERKKRSKASKLRYRQKNKKKIAEYNKQYYLKNKTIKSP